MAIEFFPLPPRGSDAKLHHYPTKIRGYRPEYVEVPELLYLRTNFDTGQIYSIYMYKIFVSKINRKPSKKSVKGYHQLKG